MQIKEHGEELVQAEIITYIAKLALGLGIQLSNEAILLLSEGILEVYAYDSIEDVKECLKSARNGLYGWGMLPRSTITMMHVREWMAQHLEKKAIAKERMHKLLKENSRDNLPKVDYQAYKSRIAEEKNVAKKKNGADDAYREYKAKYLMNKQNDKKQNDETN